MADTPSLSEFNLPITNLGSTQPGPQVSLGYHHPQLEPSGDPLNHPEARQRLEEFKANQIRWDAVKDALKGVKPQELTKDMEAVLMQAAFKPGLLIKDPA